MARRVIIGSTAASPLRISVAGVDAATAQFNACIFDANQPPLRLWGTGFVSVVGITWNARLAGRNVFEATPVPIVAVPAGFSPIFMTMWRNTAYFDSIVRTPSSEGSSDGLIGGGGGGVASNQFIGLTYTTGAPAVPDTPGPTIFANYCVFKNYN
jgi:hypothetical protein